MEYSQGAKAAVFGTAIEGSNPSTPKGRVTQWQSVRLIGEKLAVRVCPRPREADLRVSLRSLYLKHFFVAGSDIKDTKICTLVHDKYNS